jgi:CHAD domain-containing protein
MADPFKDSLIACVRTAREALGDSGRDLPARVHQCRVELKRARALLRLPGRQEAAFVRRINTRLRGVAHELAPLRERHALAGVADKLAAKKRFAPVSTELLELRQSLASPDGATGSPEAMLHEAAGELVLTEARIRSWPLAPLTDAQLAASLSQGARRARKQGRRASMKAPAETFHDLRKRVKTLYYQLCWLHGEERARGDRQLEAIRRLGSQLGREHDLQVLLTHALARGADPGGALATALKRECRRQRKRIRTNLRCLEGLEPGLLQTPNAPALPDETTPPA